MRLLGLDVGPELLGRLRTGHLLPAADRRQALAQGHRREETLGSEAFLIQLHRRHSGARAAVAGAATFGKISPEADVLYSLDS